MTTKPTIADKDAEIAALRAQLAAAQNGAAQGVSLKVGDKGGVSLKFLGGSRFPVTLYVEQWETLLDNADKIREFINSNRAALKTKR